MRYCIKLVRTQFAERVVIAADEDSAIAKVRAELAQPYGFFGRWDDGRVEITDIEARPTVEVGALAPDGGPMLLSVKDAAIHLGVSRTLLYELVQRGEIKSLQLGRRRLISREALREFIEENSSGNPR